MWTSGENEQIQTPPPPQDFLVVLSWFLLIKLYKISIFLYNSSEFKNLVVNLLVFWWKWKFSKPHPLPQDFLSSCGDFYKRKSCWFLWSCGVNNQNATPTTRFSCGLVVDSNTKIYTKSIFPPRLKILWSSGKNGHIPKPTPATRFSCGLVV